MGLGYSAHAGGGAILAASSSIALWSLTDAKRLAKFTGHAVCFKALARPQSLHGSSAQGWHLHLTLARLYPSIEIQCQGCCQGQGLSHEQTCQPLPIWQPSWDVLCNGDHGFSVPYALLIGRLAGRRQLEQLELIMANFDLSMLICLL